MTNIIDKRGVLMKNPPFAEPITIELGCGADKKNPDAIGIDALDFPCVDLVGDVFAVLSRFPDRSVDRVCSSHFVEHIEDLDRLMLELSRVVKTGGVIEIVVPHFSNPYFYSDPTHRRFFGLYTFCYFAKNALFARKTPTYQKTLYFELNSVELRFKSTRPFYLRHAFKRFCGLLFNSCNFLREFYEENLCYLIPCYEVAYRLQRIEPVD